jgi:hypothetical protein
VYFCGERTYTRNKNKIEKLSKYSVTVVQEVVLYGHSLKAVLTASEELHLHLTFNQIQYLVN